MKGLKLIVAGLLLAVTAFSAGLLVNSWAGTAEATRSGSNLSMPAAAAETGLANDLDEAALRSPADDALMEEWVKAGAPPDFSFDKIAALGLTVPDFADKFPGADDREESQGSISKVENNGARLTINGRRVVNLNDQTVVGDINGTIKKEDLKQGDRVMVLGKIEADKSQTARWVLKLPALPKPARPQGGEITSVNAAGNSFKFKNATDNNAEWTATISATTKISKDGKDAKLSDFKAGDSVVLTGKVDQTAKKIEADRVASGKIKTAPARANFTAGKVKSVDSAGNSFVLTQSSRQGDTDLKVTVDASTKYAGSGLTKLDELKAGDTVMVNGDKQTDGSLKAVAVSRAPAGGPGPKGFGNRPNPGPKPTATPKP